MNLQAKPGRGDTASATPGLKADTETVVVRFAGDSGDGVQLLGGQFAQETALAGNSLATFPDFPAEIRAPTGTTYGVSAFQINFGSRVVKTAGDQPDVLVALNPAALKVNLSLVRKGGLVILDSGAFKEKDIKRAGFNQDPRTDGTLKEYRVIEIDISAQALEVAKPFGVSQKEALRTKNLWTLGLVSWMYDREMASTQSYVARKFGEDDPVGKANAAALKAGHAYGETHEISGDISPAHFPSVKFEPGTYRLVSGAEALSWGLVAGAQLAGLELLLSSYPITPSSPILHNLAKLKQFGVSTFQAEDEIAACCAAIGASFGGKLGITASSGPGIALKTEAIGLAISTELPLVIVDTQRAGPSTGLPTKTEQSDLFIAVWGRNGDAPVPVIASRAPGDCYEVAIEAVRLATKYMTPVILLSDGYIANAAEPWKIPSIKDHAPFPVTFRTDAEGYQVYNRDPKTLARAWVKPGTPGMMHRIGGIEKDSVTGNISYEAANHQKMTDTRFAKIDGIANDIPEQTVEVGDTKGKLAVVGWGSTFGPINRAVHNMRAKGLDVSHIHIRHIWPLPRNLEALLKSYDKVLVAEMNNGQMLTLLRSQYVIDAKGLLKVSGQPLKIAEVENAIRAQLDA
ncbi:MAG: 2-oxoacid:acceptor oxidoreductase subunit alpha [Rhodospirillaceae bacterium]|nr:MAG: 2-oxoacid:acceptor oxidoreductase subunit alpha [Rhodospirillaceae bacterium]